MRKTKLLSLFLILTMVFSLTACSDNQLSSNDINSSEHSVLSSADETLSDQEKSDSTSPSIGEDSKFEAHFLDVGQADATLIFCDDKTMLIDGGNPGDSNLIAAYLKKHNIGHLDYIICSHATMIMSEVFPEHCLLQQLVKCMHL